MLHFLAFFGDVSLKVNFPPALRQNDGVVGWIPNSQSHVRHYLGMGLGILNWDFGNLAAMPSRQPAVCPNTSIPYSAFRVVGVTRNAQYGMLSHETKRSGSAARPSSSKSAALRAACYFPISIYAKYQNPLGGSSSPLFPIQIAGFCGHKIPRPGYR